MYVMRAWCILCLIDICHSCFPTVVIAAGVLGGGEKAVLDFLDVSYLRTPSFCLVLLICGRHFPEKSAKAIVNNSKIEPLIIC